jgi:hypothetical protein
MVVLIIKNGILKQIGTEEEKKELEKANWDYRLITASGQYCVIDYDKDQARPYVKALLAKVNKLKEVKLLYATIFILIFSFIGMCAFGTLALIEIGNTKKMIAAIPAPKAAPPPSSIPAVSKEEMRKSLDNMDNAQNAQSGAVNTQKTKF